MATWHCFIAIAVLQLGRSYAYHEFKPKCPLPPPGTNYVSGPNIRSTVSILWNCLSIILLCTWNIQHLNVPAIRPKAERFDQMLWRSILDNRTKLKWMIFTIFVPEFLVGKALGEWRAAKFMLPRYEGEREWATFKDITSAYLANMGYFVLDWDPQGLQNAAKQTSERKSESSTEKDAPQRKPDRGDLESKPEVNEETDEKKPDVKEGANEKEADDKEGNDESKPEAKDGAGERPEPIPDAVKFMDELKDAAEHAEKETNTESRKINSRRLRCRYWALTANQWRRILQSYKEVVGDKIAFPPQLEKLDRGGALVKAIALIQVVYLIIQLISRRIEDLPSAQLEIAALAFAGCSFVTYALYWDRPQGVEMVHIIKAKKLSTGDRLKNMAIEIASAGPTYLWLSPRREADFDPKYGPEPIPNDSSSTIYYLPGRRIFGENDELFALAAGALIGGTLFGGLHCLAWNFHFPTKGEALGWRICSVATAVLPLLSLFPIVIWMRLNPYNNKKRGNAFLRALVAIVGLSIIVSYVMARLFLLVEMFRTLCFLPPEAFVDTWAGSFPHIG